MGTWSRRAWNGVCACVLFSTVAVYTCANSAELSIGMQTPEGSAPEMAIRFAGAAEKVASLQFDIVCGPALRNAPTEGTVASSAGKTMYARWVGTPRRGPARQYMRFLIVGLNGTALGDGIIATLPVRPGLIVRSVDFLNVVASEPDGVAVPITARGWPGTSRSE